MSQTSRERLLDRYRIGTDTGCIVSNRIGYCCMGRYYVHHCRFINCWWSALHMMIIGRSSNPLPARRACTCACCFMVHDTGEGWGEGGRRRLCHGEAGIRLQRRCSTGRSTGRRGHHHAALPPPAGSDNNSQLSITLTFLQVNQSWHWLSARVCVLLMVCMCHPLRISCVLQVTCLV